MAILKILSDDEQLLKTLCFLRARHKIIVLAHGCFDWLHYGHLLHLQIAKSLGDVLLVSITTDRFIDKGPGRPIFDQQQRAEMIAALECVDYVLFSDHPTAVEVINEIKPNFFVKGKDYEKGTDIDLRREVDAVEKHAGRVIYTVSRLWHTTDLLRQYGYN